MFVTTTMAQRIERAEVEMLQATVDAVIASARTPAAFARALGPGVATYLRPGSPLNKVLGVGLGVPIDEPALAEIEAAMHERRGGVRVELATLAAPEAGASLTARGYRLLGFENVLARSLSGPSAAPAAGVRVERVTEATEGAWTQTSVDAAACSDETGVPVDRFERDTLALAIHDIVQARDFDRYLAFVDGAIAGAASMWRRDGIALLTGSATLPAFRRRGVQTALVEVRLDHARAAGAELAAITTAPATQSQANVMKRGFALAYARAILQRDVSP